MIKFSLQRTSILIGIKKSFIKKKLFKRRVKKADLIAPYLFILVSEILNSNTKNIIKHHYLLRINIF